MSEYVIALLSALGAVAAVVVSLVIYALGLLREKKQATLEAYNSLQTDVFDKLNLFTNSKIRDICVEICENNSNKSNISDETNEKFYELISYLARLEHFSLGVNTGIYDVKTAERAGTAFLQGQYTKLFPLIYTQEKRSKSKTAISLPESWYKEAVNSLESPCKGYYDEFKKLVRKLRKIEKG